MPLLEVDGEVVSSSHIRGLVLGGAVEYADALLGAPFAVDGEVVHGDKRGRELGFPTANLVPRDGLRGARATASTPAASRTPTATSPRRRPTSACGPMFVTGRGELIEAFLIDFDGDLYGQRAALEFLERLRGERRFETVDALVEQMRRDVDEARAIVAAD